MALMPEGDMNIGIGSAREVRPTMEGWVGSLPIDAKAKRTLIDLIAGVRNQNMRRASLAEVELEAATNGWTRHAAPSSTKAICTCGHHAGAHTLAGCLRCRCRSFVAGE